MRRALALHHAVTHGAIIPLLHAMTTDRGLALVYPWVNGQILYGAPGSGRSQRLDPSGPHARFRGLPVPEILGALDDIFDAHLALARAGFVAVDLYDGCFIYDFAAHHMWLCDLDEYRRGPFTVKRDRLAGSTRFMAPEEFRRGALIDETTTVFNLARAALVLLNERDLDGRFRGSPGALSVLERATRDSRSHRYRSVDAFVSAWREATAS